MVGSETLGDKGPFGFVATLKGLRRFFDWRRTADATLSGLGLG
jgi:hypothetical protein